MSITDSIQPIVSVPDEYAAVMGDKRFRYAMGQTLASAGPDAINVMFQFLRVWKQHFEHEASKGNQRMDLVPHIYNAFENMQNEVMSVLREYEKESGSGSVMRDDSTVPDAAYLQHPDIFPEPQ